jgi:DNA-binding NtrC family response regulator
VLDRLFALLADGNTAVLSRVERELVARALTAEAGDEGRAAQRLGLTKVALQRKLKEG